MKNKYFLIGILLILLFTGVKETIAYTIDFESLNDSDIVTNQFSALGITFSNATVLTAGVSLNDTNFPPHSGTNVVFDDGGPMTVNFSLPVFYFEAYFTYGLSDNPKLTLSFYDMGNNLIGILFSLYSDNTITWGDLGSSPNELIKFAWAGGFSKVVISGDPGGETFTMDDLTVNPVPEPTTMLLLGSGLIGVLGLRRKFRK